MPTEDANRWNLRYLDGSNSSFEQPRLLLVENSNLLPTTGLALDLAMGLGGNAKFLIQHGLRVVGVDISSVAVKRAIDLSSSFMPVIADLEYFYIPRMTFDVIIDFLYLQRNLWLPMTLGLKIGGILFIECLTEAMLSVHPKINPAYLLKSGELKQVYISAEFRKHIEIVYSFEGWQPSNTSHPRAVASLIVRRIA